MTAAAASLDAVLPAGWAEPVTFVAMVAVFVLLAAWRRWPIGGALVVSAWTGAAANGELFPLRHLVEGAFAYLDPLLVIGTAMIFMRVLADGGALAAVGEWVERRLGGRPALLVPALMLIVMFPGMITGSSTASVLTAGAMAAPILVRMGLPADRSAALVAMGGVLGMVAPPVNIPAMLIGGGIDLPYAGFGAPLALVAFPLALAVAFGLAWPLFGARGGRQGNTTVSPPSALPVWRATLPVAAIVVLMAAPRAWPQAVPDPGLPLSFLIAALAGVAVLGRFNPIESALTATEEALPVLGILVGVGGFIQVLTLTGARGWIVSLMTAAPPWALVASSAVSLPLFGAVSAFGSASVLGVPFLLALLGRDEIVTTAALSLLAALGDLMLPASLAATLAARVAGVGDRRRVLRLCVVPAAAAILVAVVSLVFAVPIGRALR